MVPDEQEKSFGLALRELRKRKGYSQGDTAKLLGVSARTISQWERGKQAPFAYSQEAIKERLARSVPNCNPRHIRRVPRSNGVDGGALGRVEMMRDVLGCSTRAYLAQDDPPRYADERDLTFKA